MAILLNNFGFENQPWVEVFNDLLPAMKVCVYPDVPEPQCIEYAAVWHHPYNDLQRYPNLRAIFVLGAGTDHIDQDPALAQLTEVPVVRLIDPDVGLDMAHYVVYWAMHFQRGYEAYREQAAHRLWQRHAAKRIQETRVTVLGLGLIGGFIAERVHQNGFITQGWSRTQRELPGIACFSGEEGLMNALSQTDVLVNCLPLNPETRGLLDTPMLSALPRGAFFINVSRGAVVDENALLAALQSKQLAGAALDCFSEEPLANDSPFWQLPNVFITPHIAGATFARSAAKVVAENIQRMEQGEPPYPISKPST